MIDDRRVNIKSDLVEFCVTVHYLAGSQNDKEILVKDFCVKIAYQD